MASVAESIKNAQWIESPTTAAVLPVNVPTTADFSADKYDCFKQSGNATSNTGTQCVFGGMAIYRMAIPAVASATYVSSVTFRAASDKFCVGGLKIAAILSNTAAPPADWSILRSGGSGGVADTSGKFSTIGTVDGESIEVSGVLSASAELVSQSTNNAGEFTLDLSGVTDAYSYLFLAVSLFDYESSRREYWVEGSGAIDGESIQVSFAADGLDIPSTHYNVILPLRTIGNAKIIEFSGSNGNLSIGYLRRDWGLKMLTGGLSVVSSTSPVVSDDIYATLSPNLRLSGLNTIMRGAMIECYCPAVEFAGRTLWIKTVAGSIGASRIRVSVIDSATQPSEAAASTWDGTSAGCIGSVLASSLTSGQAIGIPIQRNAATTRLWIVAAVSEIDMADVTLSEIGFAPYMGFSMSDAHISRIIYPVTEPTDEEGWVSFSGSGDGGGMIFEALRNSNPFGGDQDSYSISSDGSAEPSGTSYGAWKLLDGGSDTTMTTGRVRAGNAFMLAIKNTGAICYAGNISVLAPTLDVSGVSLDNLDIWPVVDGFVLLKTSGACAVYGPGAISAHNTTVSAWSGVSALRGSSTASYIVGIKSGGTIVVSGFGATAKSTLEALTGIEDVRLSSSRMIVLKTDGTVIGYSVSSGVISALSLTWTGVYSVAATQNALWAVTSAGTIVSDGLSTLYTSFFDAGNIPPGRTPGMIIGSQSRRLAVAFYTE
jgi:hypothetical protein